MLQMAQVWSRLADAIAAKTTALAGEFSIILRRFHARTTRGREAPFRKQDRHAPGTFSRPARPGSGSTLPDFNASIICAILTEERVERGCTVYGFKTIADR